MRNRPNNKHKPEGFDLVDRMFAALLAPLFMNISVLIMVAWLFKRSYPFSEELLYYFLNIQFLDNKLYVVSLIVIPCIIGFVFGTNGFVKFAGHCFMKNFPKEENNIVITVVIWSCILGLSYFIAQSIKI